MAPLPPIFLCLFLFPMILFTETADTTSCRDTCGSLPVKFPFGTGPGCGSPLFFPYITCTSNGTGDQLFLKTHTGSYPVTSISYATSSLTITPPFMSTCTSMQSSPNFGLDWTSPFQIGSSSFILLSCQSPTSSLTINSLPICDPSNNHLCASIYTCPAVLALGLPLFPPTNTCCAYSPANLNDKGELDLRSLKCRAYASVVSLGDNPTDPTHWVYGVSLKYSSGALDNNVVSSKCNSCEISGGVCGYSPPENSFVCVCKGGYNTSMDCFRYTQDQAYVWGSNSSPPFTRLIWSSTLAGPVSFLVMRLVFKFN